jgi:hypothetical protein
MFIDVYIWLPYMGNFHITKSGGGTYNPMGNPLREYFYLNVPG